MVNQGRWTPLELPVFHTLLITMVVISSAERFAVG